MKRTVLFLTCFCFFTLFVLANPVDQKRALQIAKEFVPQSSAAKKAPGKGSATPTSNIVYTHKMPKSGRDAFYIVNVGDAFVLVSADDVAHQILGYSFDKGFPLAEDGTVQLPPHVKGFFDDLAAQMEAAIEADPNRKADDDWTGAQKATSHRAPSNLPESVDPLLTTTWGQGQYYNSLCPEDANGPAGHVLTGCVATAMAQIINYWGEPVHGRGIHRYDSNYGSLEVNFAESNYDFGNMPDALTGESTAEQVNAVAKLMYDCGVAVNMGYAAGESAAFDQEARAAFINFFRFSPDLSFAEKAYFSNDEWNNLLRQNLAANQPVYYCGQGTGGHAFVCDGYKADDYYHFNFGWGGLADGWFQTSAVSPNGSDFNSSQSAIVGIVPDNTGNVILGQMQGNSTFIVDEPLEFYHLMGHNKYEGSNYNNPCNSTFIFIPVDDSKQMVADIMEFEDQNVQIYDGTNMNTSLRNLNGGGNNDMSPVASSANAITVTYSGNMYYAGFKLIISQDKGFRMVSNIVTSVDATTVHLMWTENGTASQWQIEYGIKGFKLGEGTVYNATINTATFENLEKFTEYDFNIRSDYGNNQYGPWNRVTLMIEAPYWQDIVVSQPVSYSIDHISNCAIISNVEDFVWFIKTGENNLNGATFISDIDLAGYKWKPVNYYARYTINGNGHTISNLYINEATNYTALFPFFYGTIDNLGIENAQIYGKGDGSSALIGELNGLSCLRNCYVTNSVISGTDKVAGMVVECFGLIENCYANVRVTGNRWVGLLTSGSSGTIVNCYAAGTSRIRSTCYNAGISAYARTGKISNCYSVDLPMGVVGFKGETIISDTASFYRDGNSLTLRTPIAFESSTENDLLGALNKWVEQNNNSSIETWTKDGDINNGLPVFGDYYVVTCPNVSNLTIQNIKNNNVSAVVVDWEYPDDAEAWDIKYQLANTPDDPPTIIHITTKPYTLYDLSLGREYTISVRRYCDNVNHSGWTSKNEMIDLPFWTDVVTEQPEGYSVDSDGNVIISNAEGLAWLSVIVNGLHGNNAQTFEGKTISLTSDIDLQGYRWFPIGRGWYSGSQYSSCFNGIFQGNGYTISNMYVNSYGPHLGLFGYSGYGSTGTTYSDVNLVNGSVSCYYNDNSDGGFGGLVGTGVGLKEITNCSSNIVVSGNYSSGSLCGWLNDDDDNPTIVSNCSATGNVYGREASGGLIGNARGVFVRNCYATGDILLNESGSNAWYRGGLIGNLMSNAVVQNCYSIGTVEMGDGKVIGCPYANSYTQYVYGLLDDGLPLTGPSPSGDVVIDTSSFNNENGQQTLVSTIVIDGISYNNLLDVLNAWVAKTNDPMLKTWAADALNENGGYPVLGNNFEPSCYNPMNVSIVNATIKDDDIIRTRIEWEQEGSASSWEVLYVATQQSIDQGTIIPVNSNPCELTNLPVGEVLDFYVRAKNDKGEVSGWSKSVIYIPDKLHWTDIVTSQPEGYTVEGNNVYISSAEGFAWLSFVINNPNGSNQPFYPRNIILMSDIDLSLYRWTAIGDSDWGIGNLVFDGNGHMITGLYCNEYDKMQGLFRRLDQSTIKNVVIKSSLIKGTINNGTIAGVLDRTNVVNCIVSGNVFGVMNSGGIVGNCVQDVNIYNVAFVGVADTRSDITLPNCYNGFIGGISGNNNLTHIENAYVAAEIPSSAYSGIVAGSGSRWYSNLFALSYPTDLNLTCDNLEENSSWFTGSGSTWALNTPPYINGAFRSDLVDALNAWVDVNNSECQYRHWVADTENVNGGYPIFAPAYTLTYKVDGEIYKSCSLEAGTALSAITEPTKEGYTFGGWNELPETMPNHDVEVTGSFYLYGDVNTDTKVNVVDVVDIARFVIDTPSEDFREKLADLNSDLSVNIADAVVLVNHISGDQTFARMENPKNSPYDYESCDLRLSTGEDNGLSLTLTGDMNFTAFQFEVDVPEGFDISAMRINSQRKDNHQLLFNKVADNRYRVAALSLSNAVFKDCDGVLLSISLEGTGLLDICIHNIHFVTTNGTDVVFDNVFLNGNTTGIADVHAKEDAPVYDLQGHRHSTLQRGTNIVGNRKIIVK